MEEEIQKFVEIRDIPYKIPLSIAETDQCCSGKHIILKYFFQKKGYNIRYRVCSFKWSELGLPTEITRVPHEDDSTHVFLEILIDDAWKIIDATWDHGLSAVFHVNDWDGESDTEIAVPAIEIYSVDRSEQIMASENKNEVQEDLDKNGAFYEKLNHWLDSVRVANHD